MKHQLHKTGPPVQTSDILYRCACSPSWTSKYLHAVFSHSMENILSLCFPQEDKLVDLLCFHPKVEKNNKRKHPSLGHKKSELKKCVYYIAVSVMNSMGRLQCYSKDINHKCSFEETYSSWFKPPETNCLYSSYISCCPVCFPMSPS